MRYRSVVVSLLLSTTLSAAAALAQGPAHLVRDLTQDAAPQPLPSYDVASLGDRFYFWSGDETQAGQELWSSDGTAEGTGVWLDLLPGPRSSQVLDEVPWLRLETSLPVRMGGDLYVTGCDELSRCRLLRNDGTLAGAETVLEVEPPARWPSLSHLVAGDGRLYFAASDVERGHGLWTSDGTSGGTRLLLELPPGPDSFEDLVLAPAGDRLFAYFDSALWTSDGTAAGTVRLADLPGAVTEIVTSGDKAYFEAAGRLWVSDGTPGGTFETLEAAGGVERLVSAEDGRCFVLASLRTVWVTDGTPQGGVLLTDRRGSSTAAVLTQGELYFAGPGSLALWRSDGTPAGTAEVFDGELGQEIDELVAGGGILYLLTYRYDLETTADKIRRWSVGGAADPVEEIQNDLQLAAQTAAVLREGPHQGTLAVIGRPGRYGLSRLALVPPDAAAAVPLQRPPFASTHPSELTATGAGDELLFVQGRHLGYYDGGAYVARDGDAELLLELTTGRLESPYVAQTAGRSFVLFPGLYVLSEDGRLEEVLASLQPASGGAVERNGALYFPATETFSPFGAWRSDGTLQGTMEVTTLEKRTGFLCEFPCGDTCNAGTSVGDNLFFFQNRHLSVLPGGAGPAVVLLDDGPLASGCGGNVFAAAPRGDELFFVAKVTEGEEIVTRLYRSDGTPGGTAAVHELRRAPSSEHDPWRPGEPEAEPTWLGDRLFFVASGGGHGYELWTSDGTAAGTAMFADLWQGIRSSFPRHLTVMDGRLYFAADDGTSGHELWSTDGTPAGTRRVADLAPGPASSYPQNLVAIDGRLLLAASGGAAQGLELWVSDGTEHGTYLLQEIQPGPLSSSPGGFAAAGDTVYFSAATEEEGFELWALPRDVLQQDPPEEPEEPGVPCPNGLACLLGGRFEVGVEWHNPRDGSAGSGRPIPFSDETSLFWFFSDGNVELIVKVLDARRINGHFWVFYGGLTDVEFLLTVTDKVTGAVREYRNPPGEICGGGDTRAFPDLMPF